MKRTSRTAGRRAVIAAVLPVLALAACNKPAARTADNGAVANSVAPLAALPATVPMTNDASATPLAAAPAAASLPAAPALRIVRVADPRQSYAYADRAAAMSGAVDSAPPDYAFDYGGVQPWAWRARDGSTEVVEPVGGGYRYYYYEPGASRPYLVRDPDHAYGYDDGNLAAVYGSDGRYIAPEEYRGEHEDYAGRYLVRGAALIAAAAAVAHYGVSAGHWRSHRAELASERARWQEDQQRQADWRAYHDEHAVAERDRWDREQAARDDRAERFERWQRGDFRGPPLGNAPPPPDRGVLQNDGNTSRADEQRQQRDEARQQWAHDQQQRQIAHQRAAADQQAQASRIQRDDARQRAEADRMAHRRSAEHADQARERPAADRQQAAAQRQQVSDWRQQAADQRQQAADQRQELAGQRQRAASDRQRAAGQRQQSVEGGGSGRGDQDRAQDQDRGRDWRSAHRDYRAPMQAVQADDQRPTPPARFAPSALSVGSIRSAHVDQRREHDDAAPAVVPHSQVARPPRPGVFQGESPHGHGAAMAHVPSLDLRASTHSEAGQEHGRNLHDH